MQRRVNQPSAHVIAHSAGFSTLRNPCSLYPTDNPHRRVYCENQLSFETRFAPQETLNWRYRI